MAAFTLENNQGNIRRTNDNGVVLTNTTKLAAVIHMLKVLMLLGKYLPLIVVFFAGINLLLAIYDFTVGNVALGILNLILAIGGLNFFAQLLRRRNIHSYGYRHYDATGALKRSLSPAAKSLH